MKVLVLGAGIIGVTTAYILARRGYEIEVVERASSAAAECSFANGGQLGYSHAEPWATPATPLRALKWLFDSHSPLVIHPRFDADMLKWGIKFLANCSQSRANHNTLTLLKLGMYSRSAMHQILAEAEIDFSYQQKGILHIFSKDEEFDTAKKQMEFQKKFECDADLKTVEECEAIEPALIHAGTPLLGGIYAPLDETGNVHQFTTALADMCAQQYGVKFHYKTTIQSISSNNHQISHITTNQGEMDADAYICALGASSPLLLRTIGIPAPITPMKGYSLTFKHHEYTPKISMTDQRAKIVYTPMGDYLRVAGTAEFAGYQDSITQKRINILKEVIHTSLPKLGVLEDSTLSQWACLRPSTPDGPPIIGKTPFKNLYLNSGHGTLGWTQAAGSAFLLADIIEQKQTEISLNGLELARFT